METKLKKSDFKKTRVHIMSGYGGVGAVFEVLDENTKTIARIKQEEVAEKLGRMIRGGMFEFSDTGRKYQYITLK